MWILKFYYGPNDADFHYITESGTFSASKDNAYKWKNFDDAKVASRMETISRGILSECIIEKVE